MRSTDQTGALDRELLLRYAELGDEDAFSTLVRRYVRLVHSAAERRVGSGDVADDVTQAVFLILAKKAGSIERERVLSRWLLATVGFVSRNVLKAERRRRRRERSVAVDADADCSSPDPADALIWREIRSKVDDAVLRLTEPDRRVVLLRYFEERPIGEIALTMGVSEGAVKQRLGRATIKLRERLTRFYLPADLMSAEHFSRLLETNVLKFGSGPTMRPPPLWVNHQVASAGAKALSTGALKMMKWTQIKVAAAVAAIAIGGAGGLVGLHRAVADSAATAPQVVGASVPPPAGASVAQPVGASVAPAGADSNLERLIHAVQDDDRDAFLKNATNAVTRGLTPEALTSVSRQLGPRLASGYVPVYLGELRQRNDQVLLWKLTFKDGQDDALVRMSLSGDQLDGFFIE